MLEMLAAFFFIFLGYTANAAGSDIEIDASCQAEIEVSHVLAKPLSNSAEALEASPKKLKCAFAEVYSGHPDNSFRLKPDPNFLKFKDENLWRVCHYGSSNGQATMAASRTVRTVLELAGDAEICSLAPRKSKGCGTILCRKK